MPRRVILIIGVVIIFAVLTTVTQLGGVVFLLALFLAWLLRCSSIGKPAAILFVFVALPVPSSYVVPPLAAARFDDHIHVEVASEP